MPVLDWETISPARALGKVFGYVELPAFTVTDLVWKDASEIVREYHFTASRNFTIRQLPTPRVGVDYCLAIRWQIGAIVYRFKLWENIGERLNERLYANDVSVHEFVLEIWSTQATTATNPAIIRIPLSLQEIVTDYSEAPEDYEEAVGTPVAYAGLFVFPTAPPSPFLNEDGSPLLNEDGTPFLNE